jgi:ribosomal protein S25
MHDKEKKDKKAKKKHSSKDDKKGKKEAVAGEGKKPKSEELLDEIFDEVKNGSEVGLLYVFILLLLVLLSSAILIL